MNSTADLIARLSAEPKPSQNAKAPLYWVVRVLAVLAVYAIGCQFFLGLRPDWMVQFARPFFALETVLLATLLMTSAIASVLAMYPDAYQKPKLLTLPYAVFALLAGVMVFQLWMPDDSRMAISHEKGAHAMECAICIASVALIPSALMFALLRRGASIRPFQAGAFAVLAASSIGGLTLRLAEANDSIVHLLQWHYLPTLAFAIVGAFVGKWLLRW